MTRVLVLLIVLVLVSYSNGYKSITSSVRSSSIRSPSSLLATKSNNDKNDNKFLSLNWSKIVPTLLAGALIVNPLSSDDIANAASSGGRSGGSSFSRGGGGGGYSRSSTARFGSSTGYSSGYRTSTPIMPIMPMYSPFGFSPFMPINPFFFLGGGGLSNLLIIGVLAYFFIQFSKNASAMGGVSDFDGSSGGSTLGSGVSVIKIQLALDSDWSDRDNIMETLASLSSRYENMSERSEFSKLLSQTSMALLRRQPDWNSVSYQGEYFNNFQLNNAEPLYQKIAVNERSKFMKEKGGSSIDRSSSSSSSKPTQMVVSLIVAIQGKSSAYMQKSINNLNDVRQILSSLAADAVTDNGDNVMAVEVLWTPCDSGNILTSRDIISDYPELMKL